MRLFFIPLPTRGRACAHLGLALSAALSIVLFIPSGIRYIEVLSHRYHPIYAVETDEKVVALTFDISWGNRMAPKVLHILREFQIPCTFFLSGPWVTTHPELAIEIRENGHEIGSHGHAHVNFSQLSIGQVTDNVQSAHNSIRDTLGVEATLIRTPNGDFDDETILTLRGMGYKAIDWMVDSLDWKNPGTEVIIDRVLRRTGPGAIILMHASDSCRLTDAALPRIIQTLRAKGYRFVRISELLTMGPTNTKIR